MEETKLVTLKEASLIFSVTKATIVNWGKKGKLQLVKFGEVDGSPTRVTLDSITKLIEDSKIIPLSPEERERYLHDTIGSDATTQE